MTKVLIVILALIALAFLFQLAYNAGKKKASDGADHTSPAAGSQNSAAKTTKTTVTIEPFCSKAQSSKVGTDAEWVCSMATRMQKDPLDLAATMDTIDLTYEIVFRDGSAIKAARREPAMARLSSVMMVALLDCGLETSLDADDLAMAFDTPIAKSVNLRDDDFDWSTDDPSKSGGISEVIEFTDGSALKFDVRVGHWVAYRGVVSS